MRLKFIYSLIVFLSICSNIFSDLPNMTGEDFLPPEMEDLAKITEQLMNQLSPEERKQVDDKLNQFMSLSEEEQKKQLEEELEKLSSEMAQFESMPIEEPQEEFTEEIKVEEKEEKKETKPKIVVEPTKIEQVKNSLNKLIKHSESLIKKTKSLPRISTIKNIETDWLQVSDDLIELISYARIALPKEKLTNALASNEFDVLRSQLKSTANEIEKIESKINVSDTAGLCIIYDEEECDDNEKLIKESQKVLNEYLPGLKVIIKDEKILWGLKRLFEKYAPEELKKVQQEKKNEKKYMTEFKPGKEAPVIPSSTYKEPYFPYYGGMNTPGTYETKKDEGPGLMPSKDSSKKGGSSGDKGTGKGGDKSKDDEKKDKEKDKEKDKDNNKKFQLPDLSSDVNPDDISKNYRSLEKNLETISEILTRAEFEDFIENDIDAKSEKINSEKPNGITKKQIETLLSPFSELNIVYTEANKNLKSLNKIIKKIPKKDQKELKKEIKKLYENPDLNLENIEKAYKTIKEKLNKNQTVTRSEDDSKLFDVLNGNLDKVIEKHENLKKLFEGKNKKNDKEKEDQNNEIRPFDQGKPVAG